MTTRTGKALLGAACVWGAMTAATVAQANYFAVGDWQSPQWTPGDAAAQMYDDGTHGDVTASDGIYTLVASVSTVGAHAWKVAQETWGQTNWPSADAWYTTSSVNEGVTFTFDTNLHSDGWLPAQYIVWAKSATPAPFASIAVVGDAQSEMGCAGDWDPACSATAMHDDGLNGDATSGDGIWTYVGAPSVAGTYQYKMACDGAWAHQFGADSPTVNATSVYFTTAAAAQQVVFKANANTGRISPSSATTTRAVAVSFAVCLPTGVLTSGDVCITGSVPELSSWTTGITMSQPCASTSPGNYTVTITFPAGTPPVVEYKYKKDACAVYEGSIGNRLLVIDDSSGSQSQPLDVWDSSTPGACTGCETAVRSTSWGAVKALYR